MEQRPTSKEASQDQSRPWGPRGTAAATIAAQLTFEHVGRHYRGVPVLEDITLDVQPGEIVCLLGPSGCGKTTLLRLAAGVERPTSGRILIDKQEVAGPSRFVPPERRGVGLMFQDFALFPHLSIIDNVAFGLVSLGHREAQQEARAALKRVGLERYADEYPHILSGGEQQRVALARAITPRPSVLLMDEPFSGLDSRLRDVMRDETLAILKETRATCMIVTHAPEEAMRLGNRIALMRKGTLIQVGTAEELFLNPKDVDTARLFSDLNEIVCKVEGGAVKTPLGRFSADGIANGTDAVLCVRQSDVRLVQLKKGTEATEAHILDIRFLGESALLEIGIQGMEQPLVARVRGDEAPPLGEEIGVEIEPTSVMIFERSGH